MSNLVPAVLIILATFGYLWLSRRRLGQQYAHLQVGAVAARLGLRLVEGSAQHNLATQSVQPSVENLGSAGGFLKQMAATQVGGTLGETKIHAVGQRQGLRAELMLYCRQHLQPGLSRLTTTTWHDLRLTVHAPRALPRFVLRLRHETPGLPTRQSPQEAELPEQWIPDPRLAERYRLMSAEPDLAARIAGALTALQPLAYVHVTGSGDQVSFVMTPASVMSASFFFEEILQTLTLLATVLAAPLAHAYQMPALPAMPAPRR